MVAPLVVSVVFIGLVGTKAFGHGELVLIARRTYHFVLSLVEPAKKTDQITREKAIHLQGSREWDSVWQSLVDYAEDADLCKLHLDLNVPWLEEGFHGTWHRSRQTDRTERWSTSIPIHTDGRIAGRLDVSGSALMGDSVASIAKLVSFLQVLIPRLEALITEPHPKDVTIPRESAEVALAVSEDHVDAPPLRLLEAESAR